MLKTHCIALCLGLVCRGQWLNSVFVGVYFILFLEAVREECLTIRLVELL